MTQKARGFWVRDGESVRMSKQRYRQEGAFFQFILRMRELSDPRTHLENLRELSHSCGLISCWSHHVYKATIT